jgi:hypothetical protein
MTDTCDGHIFIQINITEYSPAPFCQLMVPFILFVEQKLCIHVYIHRKCSLSERFIFQNSLKRENTDKGCHLKIPFI